MKYVIDIEAVPEEVVVEADAVDVLDGCFRFIKNSEGLEGEVVGLVPVARTLSVLWDGQVPQRPGLPRP